MSSDQSYIERLRNARADFDRFMPEHERVENASRASYGEYSRHSGRMAELAIRALGAGEDIGQVAELMGMKPQTYVDIENLIRVLDRGLRDWLVKVFPETIR